MSKQPGEHFSLVVVGYGYRGIVPQTNFGFDGSRPPKCSIRSNTGRRPHAAASNNVTARRGGPGHLGVGCEGQSPV